MVTFNNFTEFGMNNNLRRCSWAAYHMLVFLSTLLGDSLILLSSFNKNVFKLNKFIMTIIRYIAVLDIAFAIFAVFPTAVSLIANSWVLGDVICYVRVYLGHVIYPTGMYLLAFLTTSKMLLLKSPIKCSQWTTRSAHL